MFCQLVIYISTNIQLCISLRMAGYACPEVGSGEMFTMRWSAWLYKPSPTCTALKHAFVRSRPLYRCQIINPLQLYNTLGCCKLPRHQSLCRRSDMELTCFCSETPRPFSLLMGTMAPPPHRAHSQSPHWVSAHSTTVDSFERHCHANKGRVKPPRVSWAQQTSGQQRYTPRGGFYSLVSTRTRPSVRVSKTPENLLSSPRFTVGNQKKNTNVKRCVFDPGFYRRDRMTCVWRNVTLPWKFNNFLGILFNLVFFSILSFAESLGRIAAWEVPGREAKEPHREDSPVRDPIRGGLVETARSFPYPPSAAYLLLLHG
jgi:hypothetical protein